MQHFTPRNSHYFLIFFIVFIKLILDSFPVLSNEVGNHIVDFKFETENSNPASIEMSFKSFQFREGNGQQRITCKIMTCEGKCGQGKVTIRLINPLWITHWPHIEIETRLSEIFEKSKFSNNRNFRTIETFGYSKFSDNRNFRVMEIFGQSKCLNNRNLRINYRNFGDFRELIEW